MYNILDFIKVFRSPETIELFTDCACYWFAQILSNRFSGASIVYNPHQVHFATKIEGKVYDITGLIEDDRDYEYWNSYKEYADDADMIIENCIRLERR